MKKILILGAGRSSSSLIRYLLNQSTSFNWHITVADTSLTLAQKKAGGHSMAQAIGLDIFDEAQKRVAIQQSDIVISMLPAPYHIHVADTCIELSKPLLTASYASKAFKELGPKIEEKGIIFLVECGLDPGIDHMTAMRSIHEIQAKGGTITAFKSYAGGLLAPGYDANPWKYKFTWNPRNVVLAGQGPTKFIRNNRYKYIPYHRLFSRLEGVHIEGFGDFEAYPNRDSLRYRDVYGLGYIPTILRGTLRRPGFCKAWDIFVQLGITDDSYEIEDTENMTYRNFINSFLAYDPTQKVEDKLSKYIGVSTKSEEFKKIEWLGVFEDEPIRLKNASPAGILLHLLEKKWELSPSDKDMIVMQHQFEYELDGEKKRQISSLVTIGDDTTHTAMSKTVGWPLGIAAKLILSGKINLKGLQIPTAKEIYEPILSELHQLSVRFIEEEVKI